MTERATRARHNGIVELAFCFGFPYADFTDCGSALPPMPRRRQWRTTAADAFAGFVAAREIRVRRTRRCPRTGRSPTPWRRRAPVVIADTQDNPGGGGHGDTTGLLAELVRQGAEGALVRLINDAESAAACHAAGRGRALELSLGGKSDGVPFAAGHGASPDRRALHPDRPDGCGQPGQSRPLGADPIAPGVRVIVVSRKMQALDQAIIRHVGIEPADCRIIALKSRCISAPISRPSPPRLLSRWPPARWSPIRPH